MDICLKEVKQDCNKLMDINNILQKIVEKSYFQQLSQLLETIFRDELSFTVQELARIMKNLPNDKLFDIGIQFKMNSSIFKSSFEIITNFLTRQQKQNGYINPVQQNNQENYDDIDNFRSNDNEQENENYNEENFENENYKDQQLMGGNELEDQNLSDNKLDKKMLQRKQNDIYNNSDNNDLLQRSKSQEQDIRKGPKSKSVIQQQQALQRKEQKHNTFQPKSASNNNNNTQSNINNINSGNESWVRKQMQQNTNQQDQQESLSKLPLSQSQVIYGGKYSSPIIQQNQFKSITFTNINKNKQDKDLINSSRKSISSMKSFISQGKQGQVPFSELSDIRGSSPSFMRAGRDLERSQNLEHSPAPTDYNIDRSMQVIRKNSPATKFSKAQKTCWIDEKLRYDTSTQSPSAKYDLTKSNLSKPTKKMISQSKK